MINRQLAQIFSEISDYLRMEKMSFRPFAYQRAALALVSLKEDAAKIYQEGGVKALEEISGIGQSLALKIEEYIQTGQIKYFEQLKKRTPIDLKAIINLEGVGPRRAKILYEKLGVKTVKALEKAARQRKIAKVPGFGPQSEKNILQAVAFSQRHQGRFLLGEVLPVVEEMIREISCINGVEKVQTAGSLRRQKETVGDADILVVSSQPRAVMNFFTSWPDAVKIWGQGQTKSSIRLSQGFDVDLRIVPGKSYGAALQYFTGSKEHNIALRQLAMKQKLKLNEYGLFRGRKMMASNTEEKIYQALGLDWVPPELRESRGEIELARQSRLPQLIVRSDLQGELHCHSDWDGGQDKILDLARAAQKMGYRYLGIADHTQFLRIEKGLDEKGLLAQHREIAKLNKKLSRSKFTILHGCEANILRDGSLDIKDEVLRQLDFVIAGIHSSFKLSKEDMTERMIRALRNPNLDIISHPTGRLLLKRDEYEIDFEKVLAAAKEFGKVLEINSSAARLDLDGPRVRLARERGVKLVINTDSHQLSQLDSIDLGVGQARRGGAEKKDVVNCWPLEKLLSYFRR